MHLIFPPIYSLDSHSIHMVSHKCSESGYYTKRKFDLKRHSKNVHGGRVNNTIVPTKSSVVTSHLEYGLPKRPRIQEPEDGLYTTEQYEEPRGTLDGTKQLGVGLPRRHLGVDPGDGLYTRKEFEETMDTSRVRFPTMNFDTIDPRFMHPFTAIIAGPSSSGKSMFCVRLIRNARECIAPPPGRIVYCTEYTNLYSNNFPTSSLSRDCRT